MSIPPWARWALATVLVLGVAGAGVAANLAVLGSSGDDTRLGTMSAGSLASTPQASPTSARPEQDVPHAGVPGGEPVGGAGGAPDEEHDGTHDQDDD